jgi:hypothetical protein
VSFGGSGDHYAHYLQLQDGRSLMTWTKRCNGAFTEQMIPQRCGESGHEHCPPLCRKDEHGTGLRGILSEADGETFDYSFTKDVMVLTEQDDSYAYNAFGLSTGPKRGGFDGGWVMASGCLCGFGNTIQLKDGSLLTVYTYQNATEANMSMDINYAYNKTCCEKNLTCCDSYSIPPYEPHAGFQWPNAQHVGMVRWRVPPPHGAPAPPAPPRPCPAPPPPAPPAPPSPPAPPAINVAITPPIMIKAQGAMGLTMIRTVNATGAQPPGYGATIPIVAGASITLETTANEHDRYFVTATDAGVAPTGDIGLGFWVLQLRVAMEGGELQVSPGRHCHSTLSLIVVGCHSLGIYTVVLLSLLSFSVKMTMSPLATCIAGALVELRGGHGWGWQFYRQWPGGQCAGEPCLCESKWSGGRG